MSLLTPTSPSEVPLKRDEGGLLFSLVVQKVVQKIN